MANEMKDAYGGESLTCCKGKPPHLKDAKITEVAHTLVEDIQTEDYVYTKLTGLQGKLYHK